ncbi:hypothetical protein SDC9_128431 [bioreactor metagenome]|uniref:DZANK-type domain-containing protein n=1 Tax=bioreactor metagenome TaxID=1076179 RepID=A0A645CWZ7_9ZZZZ|nr:zinc ribbon domain-containing protein [Anaerotignum sp.]
MSFFSHFRNRGYYGSHHGSGYFQQPPQQMMQQPQPPYISSQATIRCPDCQSIIEQNVRFCKYCGEEVNKALRCQCGASLSSSDKFCSNCGAKK